MIKEIRYTNIRRVLDDLLEDAHMENLTLEQVVRHTIRFISKHGFPKFYQDKVEHLEIHNFRALLPCDLISINQVKDCSTCLCMRAMTDNFADGLSDEIIPEPKFPPLERTRTEALIHERTWKTQGRVIYTSFPEGGIELSYKALPLDEDGFPLLIDNESYLDALEAYISVKVIRNKFRMGQISAAIYQDAQQEYAVAARELQTEFSTPSVSEMESISRMLTAAIPKMREFDNGFKNLGNREYLRRC